MCPGTRMFCHWPVFCDCGLTGSNGRSFGRWLSGFSLYGAYYYYHGTSLNHVAPASPNDKKIKWVRGTSLRSRCCSVCRQALDCLFLFRSALVPLKIGYRLPLVIPHANTSSGNERNFMPFTPFAMTQPGLPSLPLYSGKRQRWWQKTGNRVRLEQILSS